MVRVDLTGKWYGNLEVIRLEIDIPGKKKKWLCRCKKCGREVIVAGSNLQSGHSTQCKKCQLNDVQKSNVKHGMTGTKLYGVWNAMINRCENYNSKSYCDYGGRGITICEEWHNSTSFFEWAQENGYKEGLEIDRIDVNGNYCPENCRWITKTENANNKRENKIIEYNGEKKTLAEWARFYNVNYKNLSRNILKGDSLIDAIKRLETGERTHRGSKNWKKLHEAKPDEEAGLFGEE